MSTSSHHSIDIGLMPKQLSNHAYRAIDTYMKTAEGHASPDTLARTTRVIGTLAAFAPKNFPQRAYDVAAVQQLASHLEHPNQPYRYKAAGAGLLDYFRNPDFTGPDLMENRKSGNYVGTLLGDMPYLDTAADNYKIRLQAAIENGFVSDVFEGNGSIPKDAWISLRVGADVPVLAEICRDTNVESQLGAAARMADHVFHVQDDEHKLFRDILRTETFDAPLVEIYGLHAFDMMMQSNAGKMRALKSGNEAALEHATKVLDQAKNISVEDIMKQMFGFVPKEHLFQTAQESLYGEQIVFSSTSLSEVCDSSEGELNARFKSVGKYALKLLRNPNYTIENDQHPADVFGMLAVLPDRQSLGMLFGTTVERLIGNDAVSFVTSASKAKPLFIQGSRQYISEVCAQFSPEVVHMAQIKLIENMPEDHIYQVTKFTCQIDFAGQKLPVEFQFQTAADRLNARLGPTSHMSHNASSGDDLASIVPGSPSDLRTIFMRKQKIDGLGETVNGQSISHGEEFQRKLLRSLGK